LDAFRALSGVVVRRRPAAISEHPSGFRNTLPRFARADALRRCRSAASDRAVAAASIFSIHKKDFLFFWRNVYAVGRKMENEEVQKSAEPETSVSSSSEMA